METAREQVMKAATTRVPQGNHAQVVRRRVAFGRLCIPKSCFPPP